MANQPNPADALSLIDTLLAQVHSQATGPDRAHTLAGDDLLDAVDQERIHTENAPLVAQLEQFTGNPVPEICRGCPALALCTLETINSAARKAGF